MPPIEYISTVEELVSMLKGLGNLKIRKLEIVFVNGLKVSGSVEEMKELYKPC